MSRDVVREEKLIRRVEKASGVGKFITLCEIFLIGRVELRGG